MSEHDHSHAPPPDPVDPDETGRLREETHQNVGTPVGYFLAKAAEAQSQRERVFWLGKVDSARYFAARDEAQDYLTHRAQQNAEAEARLFGTEASVELVRAVGNACVLRLKPGEKTPGKWSLIRRVAGETGTEGYGPPPYGDQWVPRDLRMGTIHEFAVVSEDVGGHAQVTGPWLAVPIGSVSTATIHEAARAAAEREYREREDAEAERQREHSAKVAQQRQDHADALTRQQEQADIDNARRERERIEREEAHEKAVKELPLMRPRDIDVRLRGLPDGRVLADIGWTRGEKKPLHYKFVLNGSVLGDDPGGRWSGAKPAGHRYSRTVEVPKGKTSTVVIAGVTNHGDGEVEFPIKVKADFCEPGDEEPSRMDRIVAAVRTFTGRRTRRGAPYLRDLRRHAGMRDITSKERHEAHRRARG